MKRIERGVVLADDATGSLECASILAGLGYDVTLSIGAWLGTQPWTGILVVDLESRNLPGNEARRILCDCLDGLLAQGVRRVFLKTDSTLRGNIGESLLGMLDCTLGGSVVYVPAYPRLGRTVLGGRLFVDGVPLEETAFARDIRHPVRSSLLRELFASEDQEKIVSLDGAMDLSVQLQSGARRILICDAETEEDLNAIAGVLRESGEGGLAAGPAGFISYWASLAGFASKAEEGLPHVNRWLVVCGSLHPQSRAQLEAAVGLGIATLASDPARFGSPETAAVELARAVVDAVRAEAPEAILIMGGDTAFEIWKALGVRTLVPLPEVLPGVAACRSPEMGLVFVTKAGGFGDDSLVQRVIGKFQ